MREVELSFPEGAAALEHILQAHYALFAQYMRREVRPPTRRRIKMMEKIKRHRSVRSGLGASRRGSLGSSTALGAASADDDDGGISTDEERASTSVRTVLRPIEETAEDRPAHSRSFSASRRSSAPHALESNAAASDAAARFTFSAFEDGAQRLARLLDLGHALGSRPAESSGARAAEMYSATASALRAPSSEPSQIVHSTPSSSALPQAREASGTRIARLESEAWGLELDLRDQGGASVGIDQARQLAVFERLRLNTAGTALELSVPRPQSDAAVGTERFPPPVSDSPGQLLRRTQSTAQQWDTSLVMSDEPTASVAVRPKPQPPLRNITLPLWKKRL